MKYFSILLALFAFAVTVPAAEHQITIQDFNFSPDTLTIDVGDTVTWTNVDQVQHSVTHNDGDFDSGLLNHGESWSHVFEDAGDFDYYCTVHPMMTGSITAESSSPVQITSWGELKQLR